jgi:hypothetical protein
MVWEGMCWSLTLSSRQGGEEALNKVKYSLGDEGRTLTADEEFIGGEHRHHNRWVFDRSAGSSAESGDGKGIPEAPRE